MPTIRQGDRGINAGGVSAFMPRKPLERRSEPYTFGVGQRVGPSDPRPMPNHTALFFGLITVHLYSRMELIGDSDALSY